MFVLLDENNIVIQKQPNAAEGFILAPADVVCGQIFDGETFVNPPQSPETIKLKKLAALHNLYQQIVTQGLTYNGTVFQIDDEARLNMTAVMTDFSLGATNPHGGFWRALSNQMIPMTDTQVQNFIWAVKAYALSILQAYWLHKDAITALASANDIEEYDFNSGWPSSIITN